ncbi:CPBP family intramembrane glutamic endopeptidase [Nakamurella deserti]|uniref:CPBP family intramembrane glutamic endopeptidase n=1 Tax=Nakamurella deserti TaxID=2164074 RepID=UPI000DBE5024|nr:CPBP family intramembrane glutamic endopeptidase [Nakamurella deserti]
MALSRVLALPAAAPDPTPRPDTPRSIRFEILVVFAVTLGASGVRALITLIDNLLKPVPLAGQQVSVVAPQSSVSWADLALQLTSIAVGVAWGLLGVHLLWRAGFRLGRDIGLSWRLGDLGRAVGLAAAIGLTGLVFVVITYRLGISARIAPATLDEHWWTIPVLVLAALENGFLEEVLVVGYLLTRLRQLRVDPWVAVALSALLRGSYHLYQGWGQALGNLLMGLVFGFVWLKWRRLWPLIGAHTLIDVGAFVGYFFVADWWNSLLS